MENQPTQKASVIKTIYFYLVSFVALMMVVFSFADVINIALKTWVFTKADTDFYYDMPCVAAPEGKVNPDYTVEQCEKQKEVNKKQSEENRVAQKQRDVVRDISMVVVGVPLFLIHWRIIRRKEENL